MNSKALLLSVAFFSAISAMGCQYETHGYCDGLNETNMPARVVLVENSREAERFQYTHYDFRLRGRSEISGPDRFVAGDRDLVLNYVSCQNIDGFEDVESLLIGKISPNMSIGNKVYVCSTLGFEAESDDGSILLSNPDCGLCPDAFDTMVSENTHVPPMLGSREFASSYVSVSSVYGVGGLYTSPLADEILYGQKFRRGAPPVIIARVWSFKNTPETAEAKAYLGIQSNEETLHCGDLYYGYFSR